MLTLIQTRPDPPNLVRRYFLLAFGISWGFQIPAAILAHLGSGLAMPLYLCGGIGPLAAALIVRGRAWRELLGQPTSWLWIVAALATPALLSFAAFGLHVGFGGIPPATLLAPMIGPGLLAPLGEEAGWRGLALPALRRRYGTAYAAFVVGALWAIWHLPSAFLPGARAIDLPAYLLSVVAWSFVFAWFAERTGDNLWVACALHAGMNLNLVARTPESSVVRLLVVVAVAAVVIVTGRTPRERPIATAEVERPRRTRAG